MDAAHHSIVITAACAGRHRIGSRGDIGLPTAVRTMCRLQPGEPVLLAALTGHGLLVIHPAATITRLLARQHARILTVTGQRP